MVFGLGIPGYQGETVRIIVEVAGQTVDTDEAFDGVGQLDEEAERGDGTDDAFDNLADMILHILGLLHVFAGKFGVGRGTFTDARLFCVIVHALVVGEPVTFRIFVHVLPQHAMDDQIRIAADRRREMEIVLLRQAEVSKAAPIVSCLLHAPEHGHGENRVLGRIFQTAEIALNGFRRNVALIGEGMIEYVADALEVLELARLRCFMDTVDAGDILCVHQFGNRYVGCDHAVFDHAFRMAALAHANIGRVAVFIDDDFGFRCIEVDGAFAGTFTADRIGAVAKIKEQRAQEAVFLLFLCVAIQNQVDVVIRHAGKGTDIGGIHHL